MHPQADGKLQASSSKLQAKPEPSSGSSNN